MNARVSNWPDIRRLILRNVLCLTLGSTLLPFAIHGQTTQNTPNELDRAIAEAKSGDVSARGVEILAKSKATQAIPALRAQFAHTTDLSTKMKIVDGLVRLGDKDNTYWNFLLQQVTLAVYSDLPDPFHDSQGKATGRQLSPEFKAWIQAHQVDTSTAINSALFDLPGKVMLLGETGDPRGIPLLRRALRSHNYLIVVMAAKGLAQIQDKQSIPLIIAAIQGAPPEYRVLIAEPLVYFDDALAQNAVDRYMPKETALMDRGERARGRRVFGW